MATTQANNIARQVVLVVLAIHVLNFHAFYPAAFFAIGVCGFCRHTAYE